MKRLMLGPLLLLLACDTAGKGRSIITRSYDVRHLVYVDETEELSCLIDPAHPRNNELPLWMAARLEHLIWRRVFNAPWDQNFLRPPVNRAMGTLSGILTVKATPGEHERVQKFLKQEELRRLSNKGP